jgi:DNA/RNA endonuclease YhcR with UshA esterase domain
VTLAAGVEALAGDWPELRAGQGVEATGAVELYKGTAQISVGRGSDLVPLEEAIPIAPELRIGELPSAAGSQMAVVEGTIKEVRPFSAGIKFTLDDGSGKVTLLLWRDLYDALASSEDLVEGTQVRAVGEVAEYGGELEIVPELPADVMVLETAVQVVEERHLGELEAGDLGRTVQVEGVLRSLRSFSAGVRGVLDDGTGMVTLLLWQEVYDGLPEPGALVPGAVLRVEGEVAEYKGEMEVIPRAGADLSVVGLVELPVEELAIGQITAADAGQTVQVSGQIAEVIPFSKGMKYRLDDGTGAITLLLWQDVYEGLAEPEALTATVSVSVRGEVAEYQGDLELVPQFPSDVEVTSRGEVAQRVATPVPEATEAPTSLPTEAPTSQAPAQPTSPPTPAIETRTIPSLTAADVGQVVEVEGVIAGVDHFSKGVTYNLTGGSGRITLLLWQNVLEEVAGRYDLIPGSQVRVRGRIDEYQGELEIIPERGAGVVVVARGEGLPVEERAVADVTPADEGRIFRVEGTVTRIEGEGWLRVWIDDGTGELLVFVPEREVAYLPAGIGPGVGLRVTGEVDIYQGQLEIIPLAGADVEVR